MKPIIYSGQSVRAILDGRKTQTRRVVHKDIVNGFDVERDSKTVIAYMEQATGDAYEPERAARYQKSDILWVRETWCYNNYGCFYQADWPNDNCPDMDFDDKWRSPIHMPRAAARLFLRVTEVRVERLQDISEEDAIAEGCQGEVYYDSYGEPTCWKIEPGEQYAEIWNSVNAKRGHPWESNPWVWVYTFERIEKPEEDEHGG